MPADRWPGGTPDVDLDRRWRAAGTQVGRVARSLQRQVVGLVLTSPLLALGTRWMDAPAKRELAVGLVVAVALMVAAFGLLIWSGCVSLDRLQPRRLTIQPLPFNWGAELAWKVNILAQAIGLAVVARAACVVALTLLRARP